MTKRLLFLAIIGLTIRGFAAAPSVTRILPAAVLPGTATTLTFLGENLQDAVALWTSFPGEISRKPRSNEVAFEIKLSHQTGPGLGAIRVVTTNGLSGLNFILIDPIRSVPASTTNHSAASAQSLSGPVAVDAVCKELISNFYRISAKKSERISIEVVAQRLGSPLDPWLRVTDSSGREIASNDDAPGLGADSSLAFTSPNGGDYFIEVRDTRYGGGPRHHYRLQVGKLLPNPLPFLASKEVASLTSETDASPSIDEREPNDMSALAQAVVLPTQINGRFSKPGDRDVYEFSVSKGERIVFTGRSRSLGLPGDLFLQLESTNGTRIAVANPSAEDEGVITNKFDEAGIFRIVVEELNHLGGPKFDYQLAMKRLGPGFTLRSETDRISVPAGESFDIEVLATRQSYDGPIQLKLAGLPESFSVTNALIEARTNSVKVRIQVPADFELGEYFSFSVVGSASSDGAELSSRTSTLPALRAAFPDRRYFPEQLDGLITLSIAESKSSNPKPPQKKRKK